MAQQGYAAVYNNGKYLGCRGSQYNYQMAQQYPPAGGPLAYNQPQGQVQPGYPPPAGYAGYPHPQGGYQPVGYQPPPGAPGQFQPQAGGNLPIVNQPVAGPGGWMNMPQGQISCPPGLEYLTMIDQLLVHQKVEILEVLTGIETKNKFTIKNSLGQKVYYAAEESNCLTRNCCGPIRPFDMKILDNYQNEIIHLSRPLACDSCCFPCCLQSMEVFSPPGTLVGVVQQEWSIFTPSFTIRNPLGDIVLLIEGSCCALMCCAEVEFKIKSADGLHDVGRISKQWSGLMRELFSDADYFGITFPMDLDVKMKAVMLGACFLIDAMYFEKTNGNNGMI